MSAKSVSLKKICRLSLGGHPFVLTHLKKKKGLDFSEDNKWTKKVSTEKVLFCVHLFYLFLCMCIAFSVDKNNTRAIFPFFFPVCDCVLDASSEKCRICLCEIIRFFTSLF